MSKIKPNTWLPLFGVETDWRPPPRYYLSTLFPMYQEDSLATGLGLAWADAPTIPNGTDYGTTSRTLLSVSLVEIIQPNDIKIEDQNAVGRSLVSVVVKDTSAKFEDTSGTTRTLAGVKIDTVQVLPTDTYGTTRTLAGVSVT